MRTWSKRIFFHNKWCGMKKCVLSAIAGAAGMLLILYGIAAVRMTPEPEKYEHIDFVSDLPQEDCYVCGNDHFPADGDWGEDNICLVDLNTFEVLPIVINRYDEHGELIEEKAGYMQSAVLPGSDTYAHAFIFPDNGYAQVQITGVQYSIDRDVIQNHLCQTCLNTINGLWFSGSTPAEYAIMSFSERTIRPLLESYPWFSAGNYGIDCEFKDDGTIDLLIYYCPSRYE